jgi:hypothetical protein
LLFFWLENWSPLARATEWASKGEGGNESRPRRQPPSFPSQDRWRLASDSIPFYF